MKVWRAVNLVGAKVVHRTRGYCECVRTTSLHVERTTRTMAPQCTFSRENDKVLQLPSRVIIIQKCTEEESIIPSQIISSSTLKFISIFLFLTSVNPLNMS